MNTHKIGYCGGRGGKVAAMIQSLKSLPPQSNIFMLRSSDPRILLAALKLGHNVKLGAWITQ